MILPGSPHFYINRKRWKELNGYSTAKVSGHYSLKAVHPVHGVMREVSFSNLLTDLGLDALGVNCSFSRMHLGTGNTPPNVLDTGLANFGVAITTNPSSTTGLVATPPYYGWQRLVWTSSVGGATGVWTEIGISNQNTNGNLRSRALILDGGGNPTSFPVLADEQFIGTYEFRFYPMDTDTPASIDLSGTPYDTVTRASAVITAGNVGQPVPNVSNSNTNSMMWGLSPSNISGSAFTGGLAVVTAVSPSGSFANNTSDSATLGSYTSGNYYRDHSCRFSGSRANNGAIRTFTVRPNTGGVQVEYDPTVAKTSSEELIINQRFYWARR